MDRYRSRKAKIASNKMSGSTVRPPEPAGSFSQGVAMNELLQVSAPGLVDSSTRHYIRISDMRKQTYQTFANIKAILVGPNPWIEVVLIFYVYPAERNDFADMNEAYSEFIATKARQTRCRTVPRCSLTHHRSKYGSRSMRLWSPVGQHVFSFHHDYCQFQSLPVSAHAA